jgi:2-dehydro-3-deoxyglucarate aldolase/4-hydroxy-2-oxoheptanedioate aldolase
MLDSIIAPNPLRAALREGKTVLGTMVAEIRQPAIMQLLGIAGFDFVIIDNEHGPFNIETIADLSRAGRCYGVTPIVRVPELSYTYLAQSLDVGAQGIMLPRVYTVDQVKQALDIVKYPPTGNRGCALNRGHTNFQGGAVLDIMARANAENLVVIQIETKEALEQVDAIAALPGVDVLFIGPNDLSISLGVAGPPTSETMVAAINKVVTACQTHGVTCAIQLADVELARQWAANGIPMISYGAETGLLIGAGQAATRAIRA